ncbi:MAG TPA: hypothetical protein VMT35_19030 [Ignavibacteriaceae bacterium]|nr:hypothetical protein [Ignavibacteriaceae bacterium]
MKRIFFVLLALLFMRCDLFESRPAEPPVSSKSDFQPATTIDRLILNLINSFTDKNSENYIACFSDTLTGKQFIFSPSSGAISQFPDLAQGWSLQDERFYFENAISKLKEGGSILLDLSNQSFSQQGSDSAFYSASYTLKLPNEDPNLPDEFKGDLNFKMVLNSVWSIYYWQDIKSTSSPSWSELKGRLH